MSNIIRFTDKWGGRNYGCYPINTPGKNLKERLDKSELWELLKSDQHYDERNDNQCDIHRGGDFSYKNVVNGNIIEVSMTKPRSGKTVNWEFNCKFDGSIIF